MTAQATTAAAGPVLGPAAPARTDLIWATASSQAALDDPNLSARDRQSYLEAEAATYTAAAHLGVDDATAEEYAAGQAALDQAAKTGEVSGACVSLAEWSAAVARCPEPEAGL